MNVDPDDQYMIQWDDSRVAYRQSRRLLIDLAADPSRLGALVRRVGEEQALLDDCDCHPVMDRLTLHRDDATGTYLRLHVARGGEEIMPHDHKYGFTTMILRGSYTHVWRRRTGARAGAFTSGDIVPGLVTIERPGSCYCLQYTQVHQTIMERDTVTLFLRGPQRQARSYAAMDMLQEQMERYAATGRELTGSEAPVSAGHADEGQPTYTSHTQLNRAMTRAEYEELAAHLLAIGVTK